MTFKQAIIFGVGFGIGFSAVNILTSVLMTMAQMVK